MSSAFPKCIFLDVLTINGIFLIAILIAIISIASVTSLYFSRIYSGTCVNVTFTCCVWRIVVGQGEKMTGLKEKETKNNDNKINGEETVRRNKKRKRKEKN